MGPIMDEQGLEQGGISSSDLYKIYEGTAGIGIGIGIGIGSPKIDKKNSNCVA